MDLLEVRLECLDEDAAQKVIDFCDEVPAERRGQNFASREGRVVVIAYINKMWPYDIASMVEAEELAHDDKIARVYACL